MILYETDEQREHVHTGWEKVKAIDETYWRCTGCKVTADKPVPPEDDPKEPNQMSTPSKDRDELSSNIMDIFYKAGLEHLIQTEPNYGFCETCQNKAKPMCYAINACLTVAKHDLRKLFQANTSSQIDSLKQSLVAEMPKKRRTAAPRGKMMPFNEICINAGFNEAIVEANQAITKVLNGRM